MARDGASNQDIATQLFVSRKTVEYHLHNVFSKLGISAREQLRSARASFAEMGAQAFVQRAERELLATGETARKRTIETSDDLTPHEARIARMARDGASNQDIATQLFVSRKTVEYHLHKVFLKLGISARHQLEDVLAGT